jgi:hypothetical protein
MLCETAGHCGQRDVERQNEKVLTVMKSTMLVTLELPAVVGAVLVVCSKSVVADEHVSSSY